AYLARRALDYLVGFNLSPILWRKLPGARSAGRVQSVALRLIVEREEEREKFISEEFWTIFAHCLTKNHQPFKAKLTYLDGKKLDKLFIKTEHQAKELVKRLLHHNFIVDSVETKQVKRHPAAPFTTSTLQQEASRKLGFGAKKTMQIAQQLYEGIDIAGETTGLITYMRTDSTHLSQDATSAIRQFIDQQFGSRYLPSSQRHYKTKTKNAQEAHEAIRPTDIHQTPQSLTPYLDATQIKLYELIWRRAVASQMQSALFDQVNIDLLSTDKTIGLHTTGTTLHFDGYLKVYQEGQDDQEDENILLPVMNKGEAITLKEVIPDQHFTQPSPRYTEASLVKKLEELGIGRPSTYATIISVLQDRKYVRLEKRQFIPEDRGRLVTAFLTNFFKKYVEYDFTAQLEEQLDDISAGERDWQLVLSDFWQPFKDTVDSTQGLRTSQVIELMENNLESYLFPKNEDGQDSRKCPQCQVGRLGLKLSRFGAFLGCSNYPECRYIHPIGDSEPEEQEDIVIGQDPKTQETIILKKGPYGYYLQWGEGVKPKRVSIPQGVEPSTIDLQKALHLKELPWTIGVHPETQNAIVLGIGRFGPYIKYQGAFFSFPKSEDFFNINLE
ncbi:MAG: type I DNA topoisomerase, partial [Proteobacteria bacterium]|nr:type I DNA topoisomerase [Pseudomonadota bacterium]